MAVPKLFSLSALAAALLLSGCGNESASPGAAAQGPGSRGGPRGGGQAQAVEVTPVVRRDLRETLPLIGSLEANESAELRPEMAGLVRDILFEEGQHVKGGQVLLKIDDSELRAQLAQVEARYRLAEINVARSESLSESRTIPQAEADRARSEYASAQAERALLTLRLARTEVKAPFDGIIGSRSISPGDYVTTSTVITTINDLSKMKITFQVPEQFLGKVRSGTVFDLYSGVLGDAGAVSGQVYFVNPVISRDTRSSEVKGVLTNPPAALKPGMFANVELELDVRHNALTVPEGSILTTSEGSQVIVVQQAGADQVAEFIPVRLGLRTRGFVEIIPLSGTFPEMQAVVAAGVGGLTLYPGIKLNPRPLRAEFQPAES